MWRIVILGSIAPFIIGGILANIFGLRVLNRSVQLSCSVDEVLQKMLLRLNRQDIEIRYQKGAFWDAKLSDSLELPNLYKDSKNSSHLANSLNHLSIHILNEKHPESVSWRLRVIKIGYILPVFILLITVFSSVVGKLPPMISIAAISSSLGMCTVSLWLSMGVAKEAAYQMVKRVEKVRPLARLSEEEILVSAIKAGPWASLIPGALYKLIPKS